MVLQLWWGWAGCYQIPQTGKHSAGQQLHCLTCKAMVPAWAVLGVTASPILQGRAVSQGKPNLILLLPALGTTCRVGLGTRAQHSLLHSSAQTPLWWHLPDMGVGPKQLDVKPGPLTWAGPQWGSQTPCPWAVTAEGRWAGSGPGIFRALHVQWIKQQPLQPLCPAPLGKEGAWSCTPVWRLVSPILGDLLLPIS